MTRRFLSQHMSQCYTIANYLYVINIPIRYVRDAGYGTDLDTVVGMLSQGPQGPSLP